MSADIKFLALGKEIPELMPPPPDLSFVSVRLAGNLVWLAGHGPNRMKKPPEFDYVGKVGRDLTKEEGYAAARLVGLNLLVSLRNGIGTLDRVKQILQVVGAVNSAPSFTAQSFVVNGCSDLLVSIFGEEGKPARMAFGASELPFNMAVEASMTVELA
ncbi:MAG: RidA family protein [Methylocystis sp.]|uniref:RidA family protein n=1 Tax=Methylocystis sp. TaxID=1911079 RepID=UPI003DA560CC